MSVVLDREPALLEAWKAAWPRRGMTEILGERPVRVRLDRVHFSTRRPVVLSYVATLRSGAQVAVLAEHCTDGVMARAARLRSSLAKPRHGQAAGLSGNPIVACPEAGLVLRRPGLDERLPGLRLLHEPGAARDAVARATGCDPGPVSVRLVAHRLGKRAVLRLVTPERVIYARLRSVKSGDGQKRLARHQHLWNALGPNARLRIPEPLGAVPELGLSLFHVLLGAAPGFGTADSRAIADALETLAGLDLAEIPEHSGIDEAILLGDWHERCRLYLPDLAARIAPVLAPLADRLSALDGSLEPCHRDLHEKQILISGGVAGILDFDTLSLADPALDPGNLLAHLFLARQDEGPLRVALNRPELGLWRRVALCRLAMIYAFTDLPAASVHRLLKEAARDDCD